MIIKYKDKSGKKEIKNCLNCKNDFETLSIKVRQGKEKFCSNDCYKEFRHNNKQDKKVLNCLHQKKNKYGLSKEQYNDLYIKQDYKCAICEVKESELKDKRKKLFVDHCHSSNKVRGLLCTRCNTLLGNAKDDIETLKKAIDYLKEI
jgi:hypothetical protein